MSASKWKPYPEYKKTGFGWIDSIPNHWNISRIKRIHRQTTNSFIDGDWVESPYIVDNEKIRYITSGNIGEGKFKFQGSGHISEESFEELNCVEVFPGDLVISRLSLPVGRSCIIPDLRKRIITAVDNVIVRLNSKCNKHFFNYLFNSFESYENTSQLARGTTLQRISRTMLGDIETLIPPLNEQGKIVEFLDAQCDLINPILLQLEKERNLLKEKRSTLITQAVTKGLNSDGPMKGINSPWIDSIPEDWIDLRIKQIVNTKVTDGPHVTPVRVDEGVPFLSATAVENGRLNMNKMWGYISREDHELYCRKCLPQLEDIFMVKSGATTGSIAFVDFEDEFSVWSPLALIRCDGDKMHPRFVFYSLQSDYLQKAISQTWSKGTQENIAMKAIEELPILKPPLSEQIEIANYIDASTNLFDGLISKTNSIIEMLKEYRTAMISAAVTGKIDVRESV